MGETFKPSRWRCRKKKKGPQERYQYISAAGELHPSGSVGHCLLSSDCHGEDSHHYERRPRRCMPKASSCLQTDLGPPIPAQQARHCKNPRRLPEEPQCLKETFSGLAWLPYTSPSPKSHPKKSKGTLLPNSSYRFSGISLTVGIRHRSLSRCLHSQPKY